MCAQNWKYGTVTQQVSAPRQIPASRTISPGLTGFPGAKPSLSLSLPSPPPLPPLPPPLLLCPSFLFLTLPFSPWWEPTLPPSLLHPHPEALSLLLPSGPKEQKSTYECTPGRPLGSKRVLDESAAMGGYHLSRRALWHGDGVCRSPCELADHTSKGAAGRMAPAHPSSALSHLTGGVGRQKRGQLPRNWQ